MTSPTPPCPSPTVFSCGDSPLSQTASIISILTFALGLAASYIALHSATRGAPAEISRLVEELRLTQHEINRVAEYIFDDAHRSVALQMVTARFVGEQRPGYVVRNAADGVSSGGGGELYEETQTLLGNCVRLFYEADSLLKRSKEDAAKWDPEGLWRRIAYVLNQHEVAEKMARLGDQKTKLAAVQMNMFIRKSAMQDALLAQIAENMKELHAAKGTRGRVPSSDDSGVHAP